MFCSVTLSASCKQFRDLQALLSFNIATSYSSILRYLMGFNFLTFFIMVSFFLTSFPSLFFSLLPSHLFQPQVLGLPSLFICMLSIYPPLLSSLSCSCNLFSPISYIPCFSFISSSYAHPQLHFFTALKYLLFLFYFSTTLFCGHP